MNSRRTTQGHWRTPADLARLVSRGRALRSATPRPHARSRLRHASSVTCRLTAPQFLQPGIAAAAQPVVVVANRVLLVVVLVIVLGGVEGPTHHDLGHHGILERLGLLERGLRRLRDLQLLRVLGEYRRAIGAA